MIRCFKCQSTDIIPDYDIVPGLGRQMYLKCHMCGGRKIEEVETESVSNQPEIIPEKEETMSGVRGHGYRRIDPATKEAAIQEAKEREQKKGSALSWPELNEIGKQFGISGASVWTWLKTPTAKKSEAVKKQTPPAEKKTEIIKKAPAKWEYIDIVQRLLEKYQEEQKELSTKIDGLTKILDDLAA